MALEFNECCFCVNLRTGCLIIGYLKLIGAIIVNLMTISLLADASEVTLDSKDHEMQKMGAVAFVVAAILLVLTIVVLAFIIVLLVGLHQHKRGHVKAYLIYGSIFIVLYTLLFFTKIADADTPITAGHIVKDLITILPSTYFLLVIRSYYLKMDDPAYKPAIYNKA